MLGRDKKLAWVSGLALVFAGVVAGLALTAHFGIMSTGNAVSAPVVKGNEELIRISSGLANIAEAVTPSVVNISTTKTVKQENPFGNDPFFKKFFGEQFGNKEFKERSLGSGVIVGSDGYIVTNNHVVAGAQEIKVALSDKRIFKGKVVGTDPRTDVAVVKIEASGLPAITWADSDRLKAGEMVMAIGSPFGLSRSVTMGIISAVGRANIGISDYEDFIQTDAAINPGNSGGALVNMKGELVGLNTAIFSETGGYQGIGFAIPSNMVRQVMDSLIKSGKVVRGWLGISVQDLTPELAKQFGIEGGAGALVGEVVKDSPAEKSGLRRGDVVLTFGGKEVSDASHLRNMAASTTAGARIKLGIVREGKKEDVTVTVGEQPKDMAEGPSGEQAEPGSALSGVAVEDISPELADRLGLGKNATGVVVDSVQSGSPAEDAGVRSGDVIVSINRKPLKNVKEYGGAVSKLKKGEPVLLLINRQGTFLWMSVSPGE